MIKDIDSSIEAYSEDEDDSNKPDIILIDLPEEIYNELKSKGFNVTNGSFGSPYYVNRSDKFSIVKGEDSLPTIFEQNIVIIDLKKDCVNEIDVIYEDPGDVKKFFAKCNLGFIDPRPRYMTRNKEKFERILNYGGIFVIFAQPQHLYEFLIGKEGPRNTIKDTKKINLSNWSFLPTYCHISKDQGKKINIIYEDSPFKEFFGKYLMQTKFDTTFQSFYNSDNDFLSLIESIYDKPVGCLISSNKSDPSGHILILPDMPRTPELILDLLNDVLPSLSPHLFPNVKGKWVESNEYEFKSITDLKSQINDIVTTANREIKSLEKEIEHKREKHGFLHGILTSTGEELVDDVEECLKFIGFEKIENVDKKLTEGENKEEDLRICDNSPVLIEVKGPSTNAKEEDIMQLVKYKGRRMVEWERFDISGVLIINHQRNMPPLQRDNKGVFTVKQVEDATRDKILLMTTWELFILVRGMMEYDWDPEVIRNIFCLTGRIPEVPSNYEPVGKIGKIFKKTGAVGVELTDGELSKGQRVGYKLPNEFLEENIEYMEIKSSAVETAAKGDRIGIPSKFIDKLREGFTVYKII